MAGHAGWARAAWELRIPGFREARERLAAAAVRAVGEGPALDLAVLGLRLGGAGRVLLEGAAGAPAGAASAALIWAPTLPAALRAADEARREGIPHVVVDPDADGGSLVAVPSGAPCYACGRAHASARRPPLPTGAPLAWLAAEELLLLLAFPGEIGGRRIELRRGALTAVATSKLAGCACAAGAG